MGIVLVTGSAGLIGSEAVRFFSRQGYTVVGIDNDMRRYFFGEDASTDWNRRQLEDEVAGYKHYSADIRAQRAIDRIFAEHNRDIDLVIHTAAPPSPPDDGKPRTGKELLDALMAAGVVGMWEDRTDIGDSVEYARQLRRQAERREWD